jgi:hypothetical protein
MSDENYVRTCIILANFRDRDDEMILLNAYNSIRNNRITLVMQLEGDPGADPARITQKFVDKLTAARRLQAPIRSELADAIASPSLSSKKRNALDVQLDGIEVFTKLRMRKDGRVDHVHRYIPHDDEAAVALLRAFVRGFRKELRVCGLTDCGKFFLKDTTHRKYCSKEHTLIADSLKSGNRQQAFRDRNKAARKSK